MNVAVHPPIPHEEDMVMETVPKSFPSLHLKAWSRLQAKLSEDFHELSWRTNRH